MAGGESPSRSGDVGHQVSTTTEGTHSQRDRQTAGQLGTGCVVHMQVSLCLRRGTRGNRDSPGSNHPFAIFLEFVHFRSLHNASIHSAV